MTQRVHGDRRKDLRPRCTRVASQSRSETHPVTWTVNAVVALLPAQSPRACRPACRCDFPSLRLFLVWTRGCQVTDALLQAPCGAPMKPPTSQANIYKEASSYLLPDGEVHQKASERKSGLRDSSKICPELSQANWTVPVWGSRQ